MSGMAGRAPGRRSTGGPRRGPARASSCPPTRAPLRSTAWGTWLPSIARTAPIAAGWPTVRKPSTRVAPMTSGVSPRSGSRRPPGRPCGSVRRFGAAAAGSASVVASARSPSRVVRRLGAGASVASLATASGASLAGVAALARRRAALRGRSLRRVARHGLGASLAACRALLRVVPALRARPRPVPRRRSATASVPCPRRRTSGPAWTSGASAPASRPVPRCAGLGRDGRPPAGTSPSARGGAPRAPAAPRSTARHCPTGRPAAARGHTARPDGRCGPRRGHPGRRDCHRRRHRSA